MEAETNRHAERQTEPDRQTDRQTGRQDKKVARLKKLGMPRWGPNFLVLILLKRGERSEPRFFLFEASDCALCTPYRNLANDLPGHGSSLKHNA